MNQSQKPVKKMHLATHLTMLPTTLSKDSKTLIATSTAWHDDQATDIDDIQPLRQLTHELVRLFGEWQLNFGNKAKKADYPIQKAVLWAKVIIYLQPTAKQWQQAKHLSILEEWPPSSARDLLALADQVANNYPDMRQAYIDAATQKKYNHAVVYETARRVGFWDIRSKVETITYPRWQQLYPKVCAEHTNGSIFTLPKSQRVNHQHTPMADDSPFSDTVNAFLEEFRRRQA